MESPGIWKTVAGKFIGVLLVTALLGACQTTPPPRTPPVEAPTAESEALELYEEFELTKVGSPLWMMYFLQGKGDYRHGYGPLRPLFDASSDAALKNFKKGSARMTTGTVFATAAGALIGWSVGSLIATGDLTETDHYLLLTGGVFAVFSFIMAALSGRPFTEAVEEYNADLRRRWDIPESDN